MLDAAAQIPHAPAFLLASLVLAVVPGPGVIYLVSRTLSQGRPAGIAAVVGVALGNFGNAAIAALGLAAVLAASAAAFTLLKLAGALYLVLLGIQTLRKPDGPARSRRGAATRSRHHVRDGFLVALSNPKTALFFAAFLPQFVNPAGAALPQTLLLGAVFVLIALATDTAYVLAAAALSSRLARPAGVPRLARYASAAAFIGLGLYVALASRPAAR